MIVKHFILLAILPFLAMSIPLYSPDVLSYSSTRSDYGYDFSYAADGQTREEHAMVLLQKDGDETVEILEVKGSYSFMGDDNRLYTVNYVAGIDGYRANMTITDLPKKEPPVLSIDPNALKSLVG